ncbi:hypothetical protein BURPS1106B_0331 [Burkholderia pseudomallei 1106b]|uniref:Uncharacterized protein n=1 Tax=Burkholderia pseudomallei (strain 1106a) TaxID=357348 RepID=A3P5T2_BURP0|nr:hypothetical protein BURPS1106A_A1658 [Burkholderia pseudomallei 1106a]EEP52098.1 conserved hypothetical protein [Burkholderia pseudomallei MSHR346]EES21802.1 hypothetical protein BURPS1106B_0331 [Burkholderia pseudomallei 1106b]
MCFIVVICRPGVREGFVRTASTAYAVRSPRRRTARRKSRRIDA